MHRKFSSQRRQLARNIALLFVGSALAATTAQAQNYWWDGNDASAGFGAAGGTWAAPTVGTVTSGWSTSSAGTDVVAGNSITTLVTDTLNFGEGVTGLGAGTIAVTGTVDAGNINFASGSGAIDLAGGRINLAPAATITVNNASNSISSELIGAATSLNKAGTGTLTLSGLNSSSASNYTGTTIVSEGTLAFTTTNPSLTGGLTFGAVDGSTTTSALDLSAASATFGGTLLVRTNNTTANTIAIGAANTLTINEGLTVGFAASAGVATDTKLTATTGSLAVNGTNLLVGAVGTGSQNDIWFNRAVLDVSGLASFSTNVTNFNIGVGNSLNPTGTVLLSNTANTILATTLKVSDTGAQNGKGTSTLTLGTGTNVIQANTIQIGRGKGSGPGVMSFVSQDPGSPGTVVITNKAGTGGANITVGDDGTTTGTSIGAVGTLDLRGHDSMVTAGTLTIGVNALTSSNGSVNGTVSFDTGTFTVNTLTMGTKTAANTGAANGTLNVGGGTFTVNTAVNLGSQAGSGSANATINITGGTFTSNAAFVGGAGTTTSTINLNGATAILDMSGKNITDVDVITYTDGTLKNLGVVNTGITLAGSGSRVFDQGFGISGGIQGPITGSGLSLTKQGDGVLALSGLNTYDGGTMTTAGALVFVNTDAKPVTGVHTFAAGTTLGLGIGAAAPQFSETDIDNAFAGNMVGNLSNITIDATTNIGIDTTAGSYTYTSPITGNPTRALVKLGPNTLTLTGINTYTSPTVIAEGTLQLGDGTSGNDGTIANTSGVYINTSLVFNRFGSSSAAYAITGTGSLYKVGVGTQTLTGLSATAANNYSGATVIDQGTLAFTTTDPTLSGGLFFGAAIGNTNTGTLDLTAANATFGSLNVRTNSADSNVITIGSGKTLTLTGSAVDNVVSVGSSTADGTAKLQVAGATPGVGTLVVNDATRNIVVANTATTGTLAAAEMNLSGLGTFNATIANLYVGRPSSVAGAAANGRPQDILTLANANTITVSGVVALGGSSHSFQGNATLNLGSSNTLNVASFVIGNARTNGTVKFNTGLTNPTVTIRGAAGGTSRTDIVLGDQTNTTAVGNGGGGSTAITGTMDFTGGSVDALIGTLTVGNGATGASNNRGKGNGVFTFGAGNVDVDTLFIGQAANNNTAATNQPIASGGTGTFNVNGGTLQVNTAVTIANDLDTTATANGTQDIVGDFNQTGGTANFGTNVLPLASGVILGNHLNAGNPGTATATMNLTGGTTNVYGNILEGNLGAGAITSTVTLNGGTLDMHGNGIGVSGALLDTLNFQSGTLQNVSQFNAGVGLTKTSAGTLALAGTNTYAGPTNVAEGKLLINGNSSAATGAVTVSALASLGGSGTIGGSTTLASTGIVAPGTTTGNLTFANGTDLSAGGVYQWELGALSTDGTTPGMNFDVITLSGGNLALGGTSALTLDFGLISATDPNSADAFWTTSKSWKIIDVSGTGTNTGDTNLSTITNASYSSGSFTTTVGAGADAGDIFLVFTPGVVVGPSLWQGANNDNWTAAGSWSGSVPNSASAEAKFVTTGGTTAVLDANQTVNKLTFDSTAAHTISGASTLTLAGTTPVISTAGTNTATQTVAVNLDLAAGTAINVQGGTLELNSPANAVLGAGVTATVANGATLSLGGPGNALSNGASTHANVANSGTLLATTPGKRVGNIDGTGTTTVTAANATLTANHVRQGTLNIGAGNTVTVANNGTDTGTSVVTSLNINATGKLDLNDNDLVVKNGNLTTLTAQLATGLDINGNYGNGPGITSSAFASNMDFNTVLGIAANSDLGYTSFSGQTVGINDVLIKYTYYGDADLSGSVDTSTDFDLYITGLTSGGSLGGWLFGDFDYSGTVDSSTDFDLYITGLTSQGSPLLTAGGGGNLVQAVPEPSTLVLGGLALLGFAGVGLRRRRLASQTV